MREVQRLTGLMRAQPLRIGELLNMHREVCEHLEQIDRWVLSEVWQVDQIADARFACGVLYFSPGAVLLVPPWDLLRALVRHVRDHRDAGAATPRLDHDQAWQRSGIVSSAHQTCDGDRFLIITHLAGRYTSIVLDHESRPN